MIDNGIWEGVQSLLDNYAEIRADDVAVILYTTDSYESAIWVSAALEMRKIPIHRVWMAPLRDEGFVERLTLALPPPNEVPGRLVVMTFERDTMSHTRALAAALSRYDKQKCAVFRAISASASLFADAFRARPSELSARNAAILEYCMGASRLRIKTQGGTDLVVTVDAKRHRWISNRGTARPGGAVILPAGEVATFPASISGVHVADFAFNVNAITDLDARLHEHPVTLWIEDGKVVKYECSDATTSQFIKDCLLTRCAYNVGELGFGTNFGISNGVSMNSHLNERRPGIHLGLGQHNQAPGIVGYQCSIHLDLIAKGGLIWADNSDIPLDLENITPSLLPHPQDSRDEDVFSPEAEDFRVDDCCGTLTDDGRLSCPI